MYLGVEELKSRGEFISTLAHELEHAREHVIFHKTGKMLYVDFLYENAKDEWNTTKLSKPTNNSSYDADEVACEDGFIYSYVGKEYTTKYAKRRDKDPWGDPQYIRSTETFTIGTEYFITYLSVWKQYSYKSALFDHPSYSNFLMKHVFDRE